MSPDVKKVLKKVGVGFLFCLSAILVLDARRFTGCFLFLVVLAALFSFSLHKRRRLVYAAWALFFIAMLIPVDIRFGHTAGHPRVIPVFYGLPARTPDELRSDDDEVWEGCIVPILELKWVVVL